MTELILMIKNKKTLLVKFFEKENKTIADL